MITLDRTGRFAYVPNERDNTVSQYSIGADGSLTPLSVPTISTGARPVDLQIAFPAR
jgi:6-phosphogluconolactonase